jgi:hypothetical protein
MEESRKRKGLPRRGGVKRKSRWNIVKDIYKYCIRHLAYIEACNDDFGPVLIAQVGFRDLLFKLILGIAMAIECKCEAWYEPGKVTHNNLAIIKGGYNLFGNLQ